MTTPTPNRLQLPPDAPPEAVALLRLLEDPTPENLASAPPDLRLMLQASGADELVQPRPLTLGARVWRCVTAPFRAIRRWCGIARLTWRALRRR